VIITGASSGLGRATTDVLANSGKWHVIMVRARACVRAWAQAGGAGWRRCGALRALVDI
jgi:NADP-dependent 3-hydroxy acid dehydrogenase YdfG